MQFCVHVGLCSTALQHPLHFSVSLAYKVSISPSTSFLASIHISAHLIDCYISFALCYLPAFSASMKLGKCPGTDYVSTPSTSRTCYKGDGLETQDSEADTGDLRSSQIGPWRAVLMDPRDFG